MSDWKMDSAVVPVSGAASGIGLAVCKRLRQAGATPLLLDIDEQKLQSAAREVYPESEDRPSRYTYAVDARNSKAVDECFELIRSDHGLVTHAVSNAGISLAAHILDIKDEEWHKLMDINLHGMLYFCRAAARHLAEANKGGAIVTMASIAGLKAKRGRVAYVSSKAAVNMTRALAIDLGDLGVRVNSVAPGIIDTPMQQKTAAGTLDSIDRTPLKRMGTATEVANVVLFLLSDMASFVTGETIVVDGGLTTRYQ